MVSLLPGGVGQAPPQPARTPTPAAAAPPNAAPWPVSRGPVLKAADTAAASGLSQVIRWNKFGGEHVEEPIWKAIRETLGRDNFNKIHPLKRGLAIFAIVVAVMMYGDKTLSIVMPIAFCYFVYYIIWTSITKRQNATTAAIAAKAAAFHQNPAVPSSDKHTVAWQPADAPIKPQVAPNAGRPSRRIRSTWRDRANQQLAAKPFREKLSELVGSMLLAAICSAIASCMVPFLLQKQPGSEQLATYIWLALVSTFGSWAVLVPAKFAEGKVEDHTPLRISMLLLGTLIGLTAWFLGDSLMLKMPGWREPFDVGRGLISHQMLNWPGSEGGGNPAVQFYVAYFAFLFLVPRWWRQTDFTRTSRLSVWSAVTCIGWAWFLQLFWWFPQPLGMMAAGIIAVSTQLASPWMPPSRRRALSEAPNSGVA